MYVRRVRGEEARFGVSGTLWRDALIFFDRGTGSYWSQINGRAVSGPLDGEQLDDVPSHVTRWGDWKRLHPRTLVLRPSQESRDGSPYRKYFEDPDRLGVLKTVNPDPRLDGKEIVVGIHAGGEAAAIPLDAFGGNPLLQATIGATPVVAISTSPGNAFVYERRLEDLRLEFERLADGRLRDTGTGSLWDAETGRAMDGPLEGRILPRLDARRVYWFVWAAFNPQSQILGPGAGQRGPAGAPTP